MRKPVKPFSVGYTTGKFMPLTRGHELLLSVAAANCNTLVVHMSSDARDIWHIDVRKKWVEDFFATNYPDVTLVIIVDNELDYDAPKDEDGTITSELYWDLWYDQVDRIFQKLGITKFDAVITSDLYGQRIAEETDAKWIPVDPERIEFPISATMIRNEPHKYAKLISPFAMSSICKRIAIIGPESVGKSTLLNNIKSIFPDFTYVSEWGRTIYDRSGGNLDFDLFWSILHTQRGLVEAAARSNTVVITDTEALVTSNFFWNWYPTHRGKARFHNTALDFAKQYDFYIILKPNVPFVQDGGREEDEEWRQQTFRTLKTDVESLKIPHVIIDQEDFDDRTSAAIEAIYNVINTPKIL